jgi:hypothetical protein
MADDTGPVDHTRLSKDELLTRLRDNRRGSADWAAALGELQRRGEHLHEDAQFHAALEAADDGIGRPGAPDA